MAINIVVGIVGNNSSSNGNGNGHNGNGSNGNGSPDYFSQMMQDLTPHYDSLDTALNGNREKCGYAALGVVLSYKGKVPPEKLVFQAKVILGLSKIPLDKASEMLDLKL